MVPLSLHSDDSNFPQSSYINLLKLRVMEWFFLKIYFLKSLKNEKKYKIEYSILYYFFQKKLTRNQIVWSRKEKKYYKKYLVTNVGCKKSIVLRFRKFFSSLRTFMLILLLEPNQNNTSIPKMVNAMCFREKKLTTV